MSELLEDYQQTRAALAAVQAKLEQLRVDPKLKRFIEFEGKLRALMGEYSTSLVDINRLLDPNYKAPEKPTPAPSKPLMTQTGKVSRAKSPKNARGGKPLKEGERKRAYKPRRGRTYTNPNTGEKLYYMGGLNKQLEDWRTRWGRDVVDKWGVLDPEPTPEPQAQEQSEEQAQNPAVTTE